MKTLAKIKSIIHTSWAEIFLGFVIVGIIMLLISFLVF
jgi:hypothetical protein